MVDLEYKISFNTFFFNIMICKNWISTQFIEYVCYILCNPAHQLEKHDFEKNALKAVERRTEKPGGRHSSQPRWKSRRPDSIYNRRSIMPVVTEE